MAQQAHLAPFMVKTYTFLTSERSEEVPFLRGVLWGMEQTRVPPFAVFKGNVAFGFGVG